MKQPHDFLLELLERRQLLSGGDPVGEPDILPRSLTPDEAAWIKSHPLGTGPESAPSSPPTGPIDPVAEYEPMEGLVISWMSFTSILSQITKRVTVEANRRVYVGVTSASQQSSANSTLTSAGANMSNVTFFTVPLNSVWARDYGPRYVYEGGVRVITDHVYNRPRPSDDNEPIVFSAFKKQQIYQIGINNTNLIHGGGNYHLNATGDAYATQLIANENPSLTSTQIQQVWSTYQANNTTITGVFPASVDATGHIDMWMQIYDDNKAFISDWPSNVGSTQDQICDTTAALLQSRGYAVTRIPAYSIGGTHYTFANMVVLNNVVLLPQYNNGPGSAVSNTVLSQVQAAFAPLGKTVYQINADAIVTSAGVFHCIVQHVPIHKGLAGVNGGLAPTAYVRGPNLGETLQAGQQYEIEWISDDDAPVASTGGVQAVDIFLSTDGGATYPTTIATNRPALGSFLWTVPGGMNISTARVRVVARDGVGNSGFDSSDLNFRIVDPATPPAVATSDFYFESLPQRLNFTFTQNVAASLTLSDIVIDDLTHGGTIAPTSLTYDAGTNTATASFAGILPDADYKATLIATGINAAGTPMAANHVLNFFTLAGDLNHDHMIDFDDYVAMDTGFNQGLTGYSNGDLNYDGIIDFDDYVIIDTAFNTQAGVL